MKVVSLVERETGVSGEVKQISAAASAVGTSPTAAQAKIPPLPPPASQDKQCRGRSLSHSTIFV